MLNRLILSVVILVTFVLVASGVIQYGLNGASIRGDQSAASGQYILPSTSTHTSRQPPIASAPSAIELGLLIPGPEHSAAGAPSAPGTAVLSLDDITSEVERQLHIVSSQYKVPEKLLYGKSSEVAFVLETQGAGSGSALLSSIPGTASSAQVKASNVVHAKLTGPPDMVAIKLRGGDPGERQIVTAVSPVEWVWDVTGLDVGPVNLQLQLFSEIRLGETHETVQIRTFEKTISIEITSFDRMKRFVDGWTPVVTPMWGALCSAATALIGVIAYFGWRTGSKPSKPASD